MKKKKNTEFYLLRKKSLSEADLFVTDYIKTKKRLEILESEFSVIRNIVINQGTIVDDKKKTLILKKLELKKFMIMKKVNTFLEFIFIMKMAK